MKDHGMSVSMGGTTKRCYEDHPPLLLGGDLVVYGGSCVSPVIRDADVYVGLDLGMRLTEKSFPWTPGYEFLYRLLDRQPPLNPENFRQMIAWVAKRLDFGAKVHIGCLGGHGRTGLVLAALVAHMGVSDDAIAYVRKHYCKRAVESKEQIKFLIEEFGCKSALPSKKAVPESKSSGLTLVENDEGIFHDPFLEGPPWPE